MDLRLREGLGLTRATRAKGAAGDTDRVVVWIFDVGELVAVCLMDRAKGQTVDSGGGNKGWDVWNVKGELDADLPQLD